MGAHMCTSRENIHQYLLSQLSINHDKEEFQERYREDELLKLRESGTIVRKIVDTKKQPHQLLASKCLRKSRKNIYRLITEIRILQALQGKDNYCIQLHDIYGTSKHLHILTELCVGGEMMEWASQNKKNLQPSDIARVSYQLLSAVNFCAKHQIIHRDVQPNNVIFKDRSLDSELRLIDFSSAIMENAECHQNNDKHKYHHTYIGSEFYMSPEIRQRKPYTSKTDVWSTGLTLYIFVAGYPSNPATLQSFFYLLHRSNERDLRNQVPKLPCMLPDSYFDMLNELLHIKHKQRKTAEEILQHEFIRCNDTLIDTASETTSTTDADECISLETNDDSLSTASEKQMKQSPNSRSQSRSSNRAMEYGDSVTIANSAKEHMSQRDYEKLESTLATLLMTVLTKEEFNQFTCLLQCGEDVNSDDLQKPDKVVSNETMEISNTDYDNSHKMTEYESPPKSGLLGLDKEYSEDDEKNSQDSNVVPILEKEVTKNAEKNIHESNRVPSLDIKESKNNETNYHQRNEIPILEKENFKSDEKNHQRWNCTDHFVPASSIFENNAICIEGDFPEDEVLADLGGVKSKCATGCSVHNDSARVYTFGSITAEEEIFKNGHHSSNCGDYDTVVSVEQKKKGMSDLFIMQDFLRNSSNFEKRKIAQLIQQLGDKNLEKELNLLCNDLFCGSLTP